MKKSGRNCMHEVEVNLSIEHGLLPPERLPHLKETYRDEQPKVIYDNPKATHHFHIEYQLLPNMEGYKTDVVAYEGIVAKIFTDANSRVVRTWDEDGKVWYGWSHKHSLMLNKQDLLGIFWHQIGVRVWNNRDKFTAKAKFDKPKSFRLPIDIKQNIASVGETQHEEDDSTNRPSSRRRRLSSISHSKTSKKPQKTQKPRVSLSESAEEGEGPGCEINLPDTLGEEEEIDEKFKSHSDGPSPNRLDSTALNLSSRGRKMTKAALQAVMEEEQIRREGLMSVSVCWSEVFGKNTSTTAKSERGRQNLEEMRVTLEVKSSLMPDEWRRELCPLSVTVLTASNMPATPVDFDTLKERCAPVSAQFHFLDYSTLKTSSKSQGSTIQWNDSRVLLLGISDPGRLLEYLRGPLFKIEVHDRDPKGTPLGKPSLFGTEEDDMVLGTTAFMAGKSLERNAFKGVEKPQAPYGVASFDLSPLLHGVTYLELTSPIQRSPRKSLQGSTHSEGVLPPGDYTLSSAELAIRVELMYPILVEGNDLIIGTRSSLKSTNDSCPFIRGVYILNAGTVSGAELLKEVLEKTAQVNCKTLDLDKLPESMQKAALSTYKLTKSEMHDHGLDVITGFHVSDGEYHILVLEGLKDGGMATIWNSLPRHSLQNDGLVRVLWNSDYQFSERCYGELDVDISCIRLHNQLSKLTRQSGIYILDNIPPQSYMGLIYLNQLLQCTKLSEAIRAELLPTVEMIASLNAEFGVPATFEDLALPVDQQTPSDPQRGVSTRSVSIKVPRLRRCASLDNTNNWYDKLLAERKTIQEINFIKRNKVDSNTTKTKTRSLSSNDARPARKYLEEVSPPPPVLERSTSPVFNYSIQSLNSTERAKERMRQRLSQDPYHRYTYSQQYHSMTVVPTNVAASEKAEKNKSRSKWLTREGFSCPIAPINCNSHPKKPDQTRCEDLQEPFQDNLLHWNTLRPSVDRMEFSWSDKSKDFERYERPALDFGVKQPVTIHLAGESRKNELDQYTSLEETKWRETLVVDDTRFHVLRRGIRTEQATRGRQASSQLEKMESMLKDSPKKSSLKHFSESLNTPPLSTLHLFGLSGKQDSNISGDKGVGYQPGMNKGSLKLDRNVIPLNS